MTHVYYVVDKKTGNPVSYLSESYEETIKKVRYAIEHNPGKERDFYISDYYIQGYSIPTGYIV